MVFRVLDANVPVVTNAAKQLAPGSTSAEIGGMGTALSKQKTNAEGQEGKEQLGRAQLRGRRFSWV